MRIIEASSLLGDPGGEHRQHQRLAGGGGRGLLRELPCLCLLLLGALPAPGHSLLEYEEGFVAITTLLGLKF